MENSNVEFLVLLDQLLWDRCLMCQKEIYADDRPLETFEGNNRNIHGSIDFYFISVFDNTEQSVRLNRI